MVGDAMDKSKDSIIIKCDQSRTFERAYPDVCNQRVLNNSGANHKLPIESDELPKDKPHFRLVRKVAKNSRFGYARSTDRFGTIIQDLKLGFPTIVSISSMFSISS